MYTINFVLTVCRDGKDFLEKFNELFKQDLLACKSHLAD